MARTNPRTQMMIGAILDELFLMVDGFWIKDFIEDRSQRFPHNIADDEDFENARKIIENMIYREMNKNDDRIHGSEAENVRFFR